MAGLIPIFPVDIKEYCPLCHDIALHTSIMYIILQLQSHLNTSNLHCRTTYINIFRQELCVNIYYIAKNKLNFHVACKHYTLRNENVLKNH